jgi:hypothetical protein
MAAIGDAPRYLKLRCSVIDFYGHANEIEPDVALFEAVEAAQHNMLWCRR